MNTARKPNAMLIELVIVILFFSISAGIILQLFVAASERSVQNGVDNMATLCAEDVAERFKGSDLPASEFFLADGWVADDETFVLEIPADNRPLRMVATGASDETDAGVLDDLTLTCYSGDRLVLTMPLVRYIPAAQAPGEETAA